VGSESMMFRRWCEL